MGASFKKILCTPRLGCIKFKYHSTLKSVTSRAVIRHIRLSNIQTSKASDHRHVGNDVNCIDQMKEINERLLEKARKYGGNVYDKVENTRIIDENFYLLGMDISSIALFLPFWVIFNYVNPQTRRFRLNGFLVRTQHKRKRFIFHQTIITQNNCLPFSRRKIF